ncbi:protein FRG1, partial [Tremellales sp. Uapishka_1]
MSGVVSKKLKFKGDKVKKKKRSHREAEGRDEDDELAAMAAADPRGWIFSEDVMEITGPSFIILPSEPLTCLAWNPQRQQVYAAPIEIPEAPEGADDLTPSEILQAIEPTDVNHVWVVSRLSGSEGVVSLRTSTGTFLTATPSGQLQATTPSRGPLESFVPTITLTSSSLFPLLSLKTHTEKYLSVSEDAVKHKTELRGDADGCGEMEMFKVKCQREFVLKAKVAQIDAKEGGKGKKRLIDGGPMEGSLEDEMRRNREAQTWGAGRAIVSEGDRKDLKKARKEGRIAEAMLDRRAALKR